LWLAAYGTNTRWSGHRCQEAAREGQPSPRTRRLAREMARWVQGRPGGARPDGSALRDRGQRAPEGRG